MNISNFKIDTWYIRIINWYKYTRRGIVDSFCNEYDWLVEIRIRADDPLKTLTMWHHGPPCKQSHYHSSTWFFYSKYKSSYLTMSLSKIGSRGICEHYRNR